MVRTTAVFSNAGLAKEKEASTELTRSNDRVCQRPSIVSCDEPLVLLRATC